MNKICPLCKESKDLSCFTKVENRKMGVSCYCKHCKKEALKKHRRTNTKNNICRNCKKEKLKFSKYCLDHWVYSLIKDFKISKEEQRELQKGLIDKLIKREYSCFYTDLALIPGFNASLDHRIPKTKGGKDTLENLEWVHTQVNKIKFNHSEKEFISKSVTTLIELNMLASKGGI